MPLTNIQVVSSYTEGNQFEMHFQTVQDFHIKGHINDPRLQYALAYLLMNSPKDNIRLKAIELLSQVSKHESVQLALIHALEYDVNPGIRLKAIKVLNQLPLNPSFKDIFIRAFIKDTNSGVRIETAEALSRCQDPDIVSVLQNEAQNDDFIKALVLKTQRQINQKETKQL